MSLVRWDPFGELASLQNSISRLFDESYNRRAAKGTGLNPGLMFPVDIRETDDSVTLKAELPGLEKDNISVHYADKVLTIKGERKQEDKEEGTNFLRVERSYGSFTRAFTIDIPIRENEIKARYYNGVLEVSLPKNKQAGSIEKLIEIE